MFLTQSKAKGKKYIYLCCYAPMDSKKIVYRFGRLEVAIEKMRKWKTDFETFPEELKELECTKKDLIQWISTIETGVTKTGKKFKAVI
jgi:hypothetical protein